MNVKIVQAIGISHFRVSMLDCSLAISTCSPSIFSSFTRSLSLCSFISVVSSATLIEIDSSLSLKW